MVPPEECEDGNLASGDGCFSNCDVEEGEFFLLGTAQGGTVSVTIEGVKIVTDTSAGQTVEQVLFALAAAANASPELEFKGIAAAQIGTRFVSTGVIDAVRVADPGLEGDAPSVPALPMGGLVVLVIAMALLAGWQIRRRTPASP